jgi:hypothetical protein
MNKIKFLGVWMDHSNAFLMELYNHKITSKNIVIKTSQKGEEDNVDTHEIQVHSKEESQLQAAFFKEISDVIRNYEDVLLFGPTDAKNELYNLLSADHRFENIKFELRNTDKMTEDEMCKFVVEYFR